MTSTRSKKLCSLLLALFCFAFVTQAQDAESYIVTQKTAGAFTLSANGSSTPLHASAQDYPGVLRVLGHLQADVARVTRAEPAVLVDKTPTGREVVIVGTLGSSPIVDKLVREKKLDVSGIAGQWEAFVIQVIEKPFPEVDRALVIAGSDKRGTIYGMYDLSKRMGVSPWYWWADVPPKKQSALYVLPGRYTLGTPAVKYRGIFINDEAPALAGWAEEKFGGFNHKFYEHVFELILRMKGNFLWPAMWGRAFYDDDPVNPKLADEYGIVIGTSHHEPMMRAHDEWRRYGKGPWNYQTNAETLREFWRESMKRTGSYESIVTLGMRGDGDEPMSEKANIDLLERIVKDQRDVLKNVTGKEVESTPQVWALYKEVQEYYDKGMRVPDDVTLLLCDDNWGNIRVLPDPKAKPRKGGYGIYYHYDFVGGPRNYKWLNTVQISRVWEQMHLAYEYGARQIWIVNVGDIKPMELPIEFFLDYAWNPEKITAEQLPEYTRRWAEQQFGPEHAEEIAQILTKYTTYNSRRKPEMLAPETYSLTDYSEWKTVVSDYSALAARARYIYDEIDSTYRDAFYQLVLHPVIACDNLNELYYAVAWNRMCAEKGWVLTNGFAKYARELFAKDSSITHFYNNVLSGGKWSHMMDQTHIGYTSWQQPPTNVMPEVKIIELPKKAEMGVAVEGSTAWFPRDKNELVLPEFDPYNSQRHTIMIFNRGAIPFEYTIQTGKPWVHIALHKKTGIVEDNTDIEVSVDWDKAPKGMHRVPITITGPDKQTATVNAVVKNPESPKQEDLTGFIESNGYVSIEAEHFTRAVETSNVKWQHIPELGRTLSAMTPFPVTMPTQTPGGDGARLEYDLHLFTAGEVTVSVYVSPTQNFLHNSPGLRYAVSFDDEEPVVVNIHEGDNVPDWRYPRWWNESVSNNVRIKTSSHTIQRAGTHLLKFWAIDPSVVLQKIVVDRGGLKPSYLGPPESYRANNKGVSSTR